MQSTNSHISDKCGPDFLQLLIRGGETLLILAFSFLLRMIALCGFSAISGIHGDPHFNPVLQCSTVKFVIEIANLHGITRRRVDLAAQNCGREGHIRETNFIKLLF